MSDPQCGKCAHFKVYRYVVGREKREAPRCMQGISERIKVPDCPCFLREIGADDEPDSPIAPPRAS